MAKSTKPAAGTTGGDRKVIASNRRARHDFDVLDTFEAGIVLTGSEVKSLRAGKVQLADAYARIEGNEMLLLGVDIASYSFAVGIGAHIPGRARKLLLHRHEIDELKARVAQERLALIPVEMVWVNGKVKVELILGKGRKTHDKRHVIADRDAKRDIERALAASRRPRASAKLD